MEARVKRLTTETGCAELATVVHNGKEYTNFGAMVEEDQNGKLYGILYTGQVEKYPGPGNVGPVGFNFLQSWDGSIKVSYTLGSVWKSGFRDYHGRRQVNQSFYFTIKGRKCRGVNYNQEWSQVVRFKEI